MSKRNKELMIDIMWILVGNFILALGVTCFILPNNVLTGGLAGVAIAVEPIIHIEPELLMNILTVVLFMVGALLLGKKFATKTLLSTFCYPIFISGLTFVIQQYGLESSFLMDKYLATIYGGIFMGIGVGLVFRTGASTGGMDIPPLLLHKYTKIPLPTLVTVVDGLTVLLGIATYGLEAALTGILSVWISTFMINKTMLLGGIHAKQVMIISEHFDELKKEIHEYLNRGTTIFEAMGGYSNQPKKVLMVILSKKQLPYLQKMIMKSDPEAFVIVSDANEVQGEGFTYNEEY